VKDKIIDALKACKDKLDAEFYGLDDIFGNNVAEQVQEPEASEVPEESEVSEEPEVPEVSANE
jgi:hypothetical protein